MADQMTGIQLDAKQSIWYLLTTLMPLVVEVDGVQSKGVWGPQLLHLAPGPHRLTVSWRLYWLVPVMKGTLDVTLYPGQVAPVRYKVRWFILLPGKLFVEAAA